jgi:Flp pilus assembly CpaE family ATPase
MEPPRGGTPLEPGAASPFGLPIAQAIPPIWIAVGLGDSEHERELLPALVESGEMVAVRRCLSADQLLECLRHERTDACLVAEGLHRLTLGALVDLARARMPLVLLTSNPDDPRWQHASGLILPLDADPATVRQALLAAVRGERSVPSVQATEAGAGAPTSPQSEASSSSLSVLAVASGPGSPGRTTVAVNLAAGLGMVAPTVLVDVDLSGPSVAAHLDADPTRNLYMLAHAEPETAAEWSHAVEQEIQPFGGQCMHGSVPCGAPKLELRVGVTTRFVERLVHELRHRYRYVILDVGAELLGRESAPHRTALRAADHVLLVSSSDVVGLWHARTGRGILQGQLGIDHERIALIINRHDRRFHHRQSEIEWALGLPASAVIPNDNAAVQRSLSVQRPLILSRRGAAARSLLDLAERVHGGEIRQPPQQAHRGKLDLLGRVLPIGLIQRPRLSGHNTPGRFDDEYDNRDTARTAASQPRSSR